jgi:hypothetical protein
MIRSLYLGAIGILVLVATAQAQTPADRDYCVRLGNIYEHFLGRSNGAAYNDTTRGPLSAQFAVADCRHGNVIEAISVLEDQLKRNGFTLPPRN